MRQAEIFCYEIDKIFEYSFKLSLWPLVIGLNDEKLPWQVLNAFNQHYKCGPDGMDLIHYHTMPYFDTP